MHNIFLGYAPYFWDEQHISEMPNIFLGGVDIFPEVLTFFLKR
jgi:hypothetical protein